MSEKTKEHNHNPHNISCAPGSFPEEIPPASSEPVSEPVSAPKAAHDVLARMPEWQKAALVGFVLVLLGIGGAFSFLYSGDEIKEEDSKQEQHDPFSSIEISAKAAYVLDIAKSNVLYAKNEEAQLPLASLTKLMTALVAAETLSESDIVSVGKEAVATEGDSGFFVDERWRPETLIGMTLLASSNDGARALANAVEAVVATNAVSSSSLPSTASFGDLMNARAAELGMRQTYFLNAAGLDANKWESGAYGSARDIAELLVYILRTKPEILDTTSLLKKTFVSEDGIIHELENTNENVMSIPGIVASKTGFTDLAGGNLAIVFEAGPMYPVAVVVLGSTREERFTDVEKLAHAALVMLNQE